jgi:hypothetical protein
MQMFNSFQDLRVSTTGPFAGAIESGTPKELGDAAECSVDKNFYANTRQQLIADVQQAIQHKTQLKRTDVKEALPTMTNSRYWGIDQYWEKE